MRKVGRTSAIGDRCDPFGGPPQAGALDVVKGLCVSKVSHRIQRPTVLPVGAGLYITNGGAVPSPGFGQARMSFSEFEMRRIVQDLCALGLLEEKEGRYGPSRRCRCLVCEKLNALKGTIRDKRTKKTKMRILVGSAIGWAIMEQHRNINGSSTMEKGRLTRDVTVLLGIFLRLYPLDSLIADFGDVLL